MSTKGRTRCFGSDNKHKLYNYLFGVLKNNKCFIHEINGTADHVHLLFEIHPSVSLASLVKEMKTASHHWIKTENVFPSFEAWNDGYYAGSISPSQKEVCINYIKNQEAHHSQASLMDEMQIMAFRYGISYHPKDWE